jgi:hypothetical protein
MKNPKLSVSFSGGRTSAYMSRWLLDNKAGEYDISFVFCNTGLEHEKTLEFVNRCDKEWGLDLVWLEAVVHHGEWKGSTHKVVTYETASRKGDPFEQVCKKYGLSNMTFQPCNREMKLNPMKSYRKERGHDGLVAIGIRADEIDRIKPKYKELGLCYPLAFWNPTTKEQVRHWWAAQPFDLEVPEHLGNCVTCWKKSDRKLMTIAKHEPERFDFMRRMEQEHALSGEQVFDDEGLPIPRRWFRKYRTCDDIIASSKQHFVEFKDEMPALQLGIFDELDESGGCSESCDIYSD